MIVANNGPVAILTVMKSRPFSMSTSLIQWFFCLIVSLIAAYGAGGAARARRRRSDVLAAMNPKATR